MSHTAIVLSRTSSKTWSGEELDIHEVEDLDELAELMRDFGDGALTLLFLEEDDEYVAIARVEGDDDPRGFVSDARCLDASTVAATIFEGALELPAEVEVDDDEEGAEEDTGEESEAPEIEPAGEANILNDLGVSESVLLGLCAAEGNLPADVISAVCERLGALDELERVRGL